MTRVFLAVYYLFIYPRGCIYGIGTGVRNADEVLLTTVGGRRTDISISFLSYV